MVVVAFGRREPGRLARTTLVVLALAAPLARDALVAVSGDLSAGAALALVTSAAHLIRAAVDADVIYAHAFVALGVAVLITVARGVLRTPAGDDQTHRESGDPCELRDLSGETRHVVFKPQFGLVS
jgi:hypothetical protein